jgi:hypothetical protein
MIEAIENQSAAARSEPGPGWAQLQALLVPGEVAVACAAQHRLYALLHRRYLAAATTGRFIFMRRPLLGGFRPFDVRWQDVKDAKLTVGMFSATVTLTYSANLSDSAGGEGDLRVLQVSGLRREPAQALYRQCQAEEQAWREKRRIRSIEEMRAQAGGVQIATGVYPERGGQAPGPAGGERPLEPQVAAMSRDGDPAERLSRAKKMLAEGLITDAEYEAIKARIVGAL